MRTLFGLVTFEMGGYGMTNLIIAFIAGLAVGIVVSGLVSGVMDEWLKDKKKDR